MKTINLVPYTSSQDAWAETFYKQIKQPGRVLIQIWGNDFFHEERHYWTHPYVGKNYILPDFIQSTNGYFSITKEEYAFLVKHSTLIK